MIRVSDKIKCTGCASCFHVCPVSCITMTPDEEGFLYPVVDENKCIECHKCENVCPVINKIEIKMIMKSVMQLIINPKKAEKKFIRWNVYCNCKKDIPKMVSCMELLLMRTFRLNIPAQEMKMNWTDC